MNNNLLVSVIVPVYNCEKYLPKCIESIICYEYNDIELIIVDDGSTDKSREIINDYIKNDARIKLISQENSGPSIARNKGIRVAKGEYILFVDADDWIEKETILNFRNILISKKYDTIIFNYKKIDFNLNSIINPAIFDDGFVYKDENKNELYKMLITSNELNSPWGKFYSSKIIKNNNIIFREEMKYLEDIVFNMSYFYYSKKGLYKNFHYYNYRYNPASLTKSFNVSKLSDLEKLYNYTLVYVQKYDLDKNTKEKAYNLILRTLLNLITQALLNNYPVVKLKNIMSKPVFKKIISNSKACGLKQIIKKQLIRYNCYKLFKCVVCLNSTLQFRKGKI